jgi:NAD(P)-dependent dehydrogenase (short-subunit alcohol dehydrogenase family)
MELSQATVLMTGSTDGVGRLVAKRVAAAGTPALASDRVSRVKRAALGAMVKEGEDSAGTQSSKAWR